MTYQGETIWIIGASSGIGAALAKVLAQQGATLILSARREEKLLALQQQLGSQHQVYPMDVADPAQVKTCIEVITAHTTRLDRVILMAAHYRKTSNTAHDMSFAERCIAVNIMGAIYLYNAVLPLFERQTGGQLAFCGSMAGLTGMPGGQPYSMTKAALINFAESCHAETPDAINIKLINPGFVKTRITDKNQFHMPCLITSEAAATAIARGLQKRAFEIHCPKRFTYLVKAFAHLPYGIKLWITHKLRDKA